VALQQGVSRLDELVDVAGGEDKTAAGTAEALGEGETEATGAAGDEDNSVFAGSACGTRSESVGGGCGGQATEDRQGCRGSLHGRNPIRCRSENSIADFV
jgi:hypothetical protein